MLIHYDESKCLPAGWARGIGLLSVAYGPIRQVRGEYGRQALAVRTGNVVRSEAGARTPNFIFRYGRSSDCSGILFEKKIQRGPRKTGALPKLLKNV